MNRKKQARNVNILLWLIFCGTALGIPWVTIWPKGIKLESYWTWATWASYAPLVLVVIASSAYLIRGWIKESNAHS